MSASPRPSYDTRRRLVGVMHGSNTWSVNTSARPAGVARTTGQPIAVARTEPAFRSPWGELERQIPYVTITTQPFPLEWWAPPDVRAAAVARATALPVDAGTQPGPAVQAFGQPYELSLEKAGLVTVAEPVRVEPVIAEPVIAAAPWPSASEPPAPHPPTVADLVAMREQRTRDERTKRQQRHRRGFATRLVVLAIGLVISLIAVETATRRKG